MPPKKIKLVKKEKTSTKEVKDVKDIIVDSDEIDKQDLENPARKYTDKIFENTRELEGLQPSKQDLENPSRKFSRAKKEEEKEDVIEEEEKDLEIKEDVEEDVEEDVKEDIEEEEEEPVEPEPVKQEPLKKPKESSQKPKESSQKTKESSQKTRESSQSKPSTETSFDMFGSNNIDYRETILNYDCSKNKTLPKMTKYEIALVIGKRAKQIEDGANANIKVMPGKNSIEIAEEELRQGVIPFYIKRPIGNSFELFKLADMEFYID